MEQYDDALNVCPHCGYVCGTPAEESIHMQPGTLLHDRYIVGRVLGYGGFGVTYIGWDGKLEQKVAIKEYLPGEFSTRMPGQSQVTVFNGDKSEQFRDGLKKFVEESKRLAKFQNEAGIVKIFDSFEENETAYIIMEYLDGITLKEYLGQVGTIPEDEAINMLMPVMESLQTVHAEGLLHRDIAPDNIFLTKDGSVKLIDFGASRYATTSHSRSLTVIIKPGYSPEEQYRSRGDQGPYTDVYAIAATLYRMITGKTPPDAMERRAKYENQNKDILIEPHKLVKNISRNREVAILNAMNVRVEDRTPDIKTFIEELNADPPAKRRYGKIKKIDIYSWPLWLKILVPSLLTVAIAVGVLTLTGVINFKSMFNAGNIEGFVRVPNIVGESEEKAKSEPEFRDGQLRLDFGVKKFSEENENIVIEQDHSEGEYLTIGSVVRYNKSAGSEKDYELEVSEDGTITFGKSYDGFGIDEEFLGSSNVEAYLQSKGLNVQTREEYSSEYPTKGTIIRIVTADGNTITAGTTLKAGDTVIIYYSKGQAPSEVPNVVGKDLSEALIALSQAGFNNVVPMPEENDSYPENEVISQDPPSGTVASVDDTITVFYATAEPIAFIPVVAGMSKNEAKEELSNFTVEFRQIYDSEVEEGLVIRTSPEGGMNVPKGSTIVVYISKGPQPVKVTFDYGDGSRSTTETKYYEKPYGSLPTPTRNGYTFSGWYLSRAYTREITSSDTVNNSEDHTLYARWTAGEYTVSFNSNGGSAVSPIGVTYGKKYGNLPLPTKPGYTFDGWYTDSGEKVTADSTVNVDRNHTLNAKWRENTYTVRFNPTGGSVSGSTKSRKYGQSYGDLPTPTKAGYKFEGWYTSSSGGTKIYSSDTFVFTEDIELYARWSPATYTVSFNSNGGSSVSSISVKYGDTYGTLPTPKKDYYKFVGWYTSPSGGTKVSSGDTFNSASNITLYAQWEQNSTSGWVEESKAPAGAQIVETRYTYTKRSTSTGSSPSKSGWKKDDTVSPNPKKTYGKWSEWGIEKITKTDTLDVGEGKVYRYYYKQCQSCGNRQPYYNTACYSCGKTVTNSASYVKWSDVPYNKSSAKKVSQNNSKMVTTALDGTKWFFSTGNLNDTSIGTRDSDSAGVGTVVIRQGYRSRSITTTYYFYKEESLTSTSKPSGSGISNVKKEVRYISR